MNKQRQLRLFEQDKKEKILEKYVIKDMNDWYDVDADLIIADPPFGINFEKKSSVYNRNEENVVGGYVEWKSSEYKEKIGQLVSCVSRNLKEDGQALIFSGWNNSNIIYNQVVQSNLFLRGKMYWTYSFAPACDTRPSHNVYEIYWMTKGSKWKYNNRCTTYHCKDGEPNLSVMNFKRDYKEGAVKYPTMLPFMLLKCLLEHFSDVNDFVFDPLCGSGMVGVACCILERKFLIGDLNLKGKTVFEYLLD